MTRTKRPLSKISVSGTASPIDASISPFLIDPNSLHYHPNISSTPYNGTWLKLPVTIHPMPSRQSALDALRELSTLRHPNLEQLLGAVVHPSSNHCLVTEYVHGSSLERNISVASHLRTALTIIVDISRALVYYHVTTGVAHTAVCPETILYDERRARAVLLLSNVSQVRRSACAPELRDGKKAAFASDVYSFGTVMMDVLSESVERFGDAGLIAARKRVERVLRECCTRNVRERPSMEKVCGKLSEYVESVL